MLLWGWQLTPLWEPERYDAITHVAMALHFSEWREVEFAVLTVYGDASGSAVQRNERAQVVAGFMANAGLWVDFTKEWDGFLCRNHLSGLHMTDLSNDPDIRTPILDEAIGIIGSLNYDLRVFATVVDSDDFRAYQQEHEHDGFSLGPGNHAYPFAAMVHVDSIHRYCEENHLHAPKLFIYEAGDPFQDDLRRALVARGYPEPIFRDKTYKIRQLEASDFLAYELLHGYRQCCVVDTERESNNLPTREISPYLWRFMHMPGAKGIYTSANMPSLHVIETHLKRMEEIRRKVFAP